jgi:hypothetical protein
MRLLQLVDGANVRRASAARTADNRYMRSRESSDSKTVYWHRELPPIDAEPLTENVVEAASLRVQGTLEHRSELWDRCYADLMQTLSRRLEQEIVRLGGDCAHVLDESIDSRHDDASGDVWLHGKLTYILMRRSRAEG